jgi:DNA (cytosine-5)-methyltransferase 1
VADQAPDADADPALSPRLTCEMVARLQGWQDDWGWRFSGRKTARYRQIGNAFPPPVAEAVGSAIRRALEHAGTSDAGSASVASAVAAPASAPGDGVHVHDPVFRVLSSRTDFLTVRQIAELGGGLAGPAGLSRAAVLSRLRHLGQDFELEVADSGSGSGSGSGDGPAYRLGRFKAFLGQPEHARHERFAARRTTIS